MPQLERRACPSPVPDGFGLRGGAANLLPIMVSQALRRNPPLLDSQRSGSGFGSSSDTPTRWRSPPLLPLPSGCICLWSSMKNQRCVGSSARTMTTIAETSVAGGRACKVGTNHNSGGIGRKQVRGDQTTLGSWQSHMSQNQTSGESGVALLRIGRFTSKWRCQCGCRMLADFPGVISHKPVWGPRDKALMGCPADDSPTDRFGITSNLRPNELRSSGELRAREEPRNRISLAAQQKCWCAEIHCQTR
jgi:hypothetical protein